MEILDSYNLIIAGTVVVILSFFFSEISRKTNIPSVLMLIALGVVAKIGLDNAELGHLNFFPILEVLGIVGLIMIVLEAALELELRREKLVPILKAFLVAAVGLVGSAWVTTLILKELVPGMSELQSWLYATPLSILSSAIIIPSVSGLNASKKEFHVYESTFSDILGIIMFYFFSGQIETGEHNNSGGFGFFGSIALTIALSVIASYALVFLFQNLRSNVKLFLLISVLLLMYALGKKMHLSSLIIILIFGLINANMSLFFRGKLGKYLDLEKAKVIYENLHVITMETAFVVRTFFFVIFGLTISLATLVNTEVALISGLIILSIYAIRAILLLLMMGKEIFPQVFIAPRGLITILLFYAIPAEAAVPGFEPGILLFSIIGTSLIMTAALIHEKRRSGKAIKNAMGLPVGNLRWKAPTMDEVPADESEQDPEL